MSSVDGTAAAAAAAAAASTSPSKSGGGRSRASPRRRSLSPEVAAAKREQVAARIARKKIVRRQSSNMMATLSAIASEVRSDGAPAPSSSPSTTSFSSSVSSSSSALSSTAALPVVPVEEGAGVVADGSASDVITVGELFMNLHTPSCSSKFSYLYQSKPMQWVVSLFFEYPQYRSYAAVKQEIVKRCGFKGFREHKGFIQEILHIFNEEIRRPRPEPVTLLELQMIADNVLQMSEPQLQLKHERLTQQQLVRQQAEQMEQNGYDFESDDDEEAFFPAQNHPHAGAGALVQTLVSAVSRAAQQQRRPTPSQAHDTFRKTIFVVRHGKSVWNKAQEEKDLVALIGRDHGLCAAGVEQAERLNSCVRRVVEEHQTKLRRESGIALRAVADSPAAAVADLGHAADPISPQEELEQQFFRAGEIFVSPLTRAIQTALIGLQNHPSAKRRGIKLMREIREVKHTVGGLDTLGVAKGEEIRARTLSKLDELYLGEFVQLDSNGVAMAFPHDDSRAREAYEKLKKYAAIPIDHTDVTDMWWTVMTDTKSALDVRVTRLLERIRESPYESVVLVGHSLFFKHLMGEYQHPAFQEEDPLYASLFRNSKLENCGVAALELDFSVSDLKHVVRNITMMFGSKTISSKKRRVHDEVSQVQTEKYGVEWQKDYECKACVVCSAKFTFTRRRHHCRFCGRIICSRCSRYNLDNVKTKQSERACDLCVEASSKKPSLVRPMPIDLDRDRERSANGGSSRSPRGSKRLSKGAAGGAGRPAGSSDSIRSSGSSAPTTPGSPDLDVEEVVVDPELLRHRNDHQRAAQRIPESTSIDIV